MKQYFNVEDLNEFLDQDAFLCDMANEKNGYNTIQHLTNYIQLYKLS